MSDCKESISKYPPKANIKSEIQSPLIKPFKQGCKKFLTAFTVDSESEEKEEIKDEKEENLNKEIIKGKKD
jgi:hypothetical protein